MGKWISIKEKLPLRGMNVVLALSHSFFTPIGFYHQGEKVFKSEICCNRCECKILENVTHWQKMQKPPKETLENINKFMKEDAEKKGYI